MRAEKLSLVFSAAGHLFIHLFTAMYFTIALAMEQQGFLKLSYADLTPLWGIGAMLVGLAALPAGWLADRWSSVGMMVIYFFGLGAAGLACALSEGTSLLWIGLTSIGLFAAIYHPVGIPWVVRNAKKRGKALGLNGIFGTAGVAVAGLVAGVLSDSISWRAAFYVPAGISLAFGVALLICWRRGLVSEGDAQRMNDGKAPPSRGEMWRAFFTLTISMTCMGLVFQAMQTAAPKLFELRLGEQLSGTFGSGASGPGMAVALTYTVGGLMQLIGGHLSDRFPQKPIYLFSLLAQAIVVTLIAQMSGFGIIAFAALSAAFSTGALPAESIMLARFSPQRHRSLAFGAKYVLAFGTAPLAIWVASEILTTTGEYVWLLYAMGATALVGAIAAWQLPGDGKKQPVEMKALAAE